MEEGGDGLDRGELQVEGLAVAGGLVGVESTAVQDHVRVGGGEEKSIWGEGFELLAEGEGEALGLLEAELREGAEGLEEDGLGVEALVELLEEGAVDLRGEERIEAGGRDSGGRRRLGVEVEAEALGDGEGVERALGVAAEDVVGDDLLRLQGEMSGGRR